MLSVRRSFRTRSTKHEIRNKLETRNPNDEKALPDDVAKPVWVIGASDLLFVSDFGFRISRFRDASCELALLW